MKNLIFILLAFIMISGCSKHRFPDPYAGFNHPSAEQGYWKEITSDKQTIGELHLHSKGFSITYNPFETYKDYWGSYMLNEGKNKIRTTIDSGSKLPDFSKAMGNFRRIGDNEISISGIALDSRRPSKMEFRFERFNSHKEINKPKKKTASKPSERI